MVEGCGSKCLKYTLFTLNVLIFLFGAVALGLGIWALVDKNIVSNLAKIDTSGSLGALNVPGLLQSGAILLCVGGGVMLVLGFLGCWGAIKESRCFLGLYAGFLIVIVILEFAAAIVAIVMRTRLEAELKKSWQNGLRTQYDGIANSSNLFSRSMDYTQVTFDCCGVETYTDYQNATVWINRRSQTVPVSCCKLKEKNSYYNNLFYDVQQNNCTTSPTVSSAWVAVGEGCYNSVRAFLSTKLAVVIGIAFAIVAVQIIAIVGSCCLMRTIKEESLN